MKNGLGLIILIFSISFYSSQERAILNETPPVKGIQVLSKDITLVKYEDLENKIKEEKNELLVLNFWSTTCAPCVKELPDFMEINKKFKDNAKFKMLLVSLDRAKDKDRVIEFLKKKNINAEVVLLDDIKRMNTWIPRFEKNWDGNIPVTIFYKNGEKIHFNDGEMSKNDLENTIIEHLN